MTELLAWYQQNLKLLFEQSDTPALFDAAEVDWKVAPPRLTHKPGREELPLSLSQLRLPHDQGISFAQIARVLSAVYSPNQRKLDTNWLYTVDKVLHWRSTYARSVISGGGLYPIEIYVCAQGVDRLADGVYYFAAGLAALQRIRAGAVSEAVEAACWRRSTPASVYFVTTTRFWKNVFKYQNLSHQVISLDHGAVIAGLLDALAHEGLPAGVCFEFDDARLDSIVDLEAGQEVSLAVIGCRSKNVPSPSVWCANDGFTAATPPDELSHRREIPVLLLDLHAESRKQMVGPPACGCSGTDDAACAEPPIKVADPRSRHSSYGRMDPTRQATRAQLMALLTAGLRGYGNCVHCGKRAPSSVYLQCITLRIEGMEQAVYQYSPEYGSIQRVALLEAGPAELARLSLLPNHGVSQAAAVIVVISQPNLAMKYWNERGFRVSKAQSGMVAQRLYMETAAQGLVGGVVLGCCDRGIAKVFPKQSPDDAIDLMFFVGSPLPRQTMFSLPLTIVGLDRRDYDT